MTEKTTQSKRRVFLAVLATALVAYPAGILTAHLTSDPAAKPPPVRVTESDDRDLAEAQFRADTPPVATKAAPGAPSVEYDIPIATPVMSQPVDRELQMGQRQAVELNEMICAETGQNCAVADMARRQYEERYGGE